MLRAGCFAIIGLLLVGGGMASAAEPIAFENKDQAVQAFDQFWKSMPRQKVTPTGLARSDYLKLIAGNVDFFKQFQRADGAIIDPIEHAEIQYSTPAFALAAGVLVKDAGRKDLLEPASRALSCSLTALLARKAANGHSDFYIPLIMHAHRLLKDQVDVPTREKWAQQLRSIDPATMYSAAQRGMNWNIVSDSGEFLRRADGFVPADKTAGQMDYLEQCLAGHLKHFTRFGMYEDPNAPLAYDLFARIWLEDALQGGTQSAYEGKYARQIRDFLHVGSLSTLLLVSPAGEWPNGGRSAFHNWNEAAVAMLCEIEANQWKRAGRADVAGAFKRAAHLALHSLQRWQRPTGELWIVKNRADPRERLGFESYSYTSQYNLLPMAMLAMAYGEADDAIAEQTVPSESGAYVFDLRETFHKVIAAAGGYYVEIDTGADPHYNATGLQRIQRAGVAFSPLSDSAAAERAYGPSGAGSPKAAMTPGMQWKAAAGAGWQSLADFSWAQGKLPVKRAALQELETSANTVHFSLEYTLGAGDSADLRLKDAYVLSSAGLECTESLTLPPPAGPPAAVRVRLPALVSDGSEATAIALSAGSAAISHHGSRLEFTLLGTAAGTALQRGGPEIPCHIGFLQALMGDLPAGSTEVHWRITLAAEK